MLLWTTDSNNHKGEPFPVEEGGGGGDNSCEGKKGHCEQVLGAGVKERKRRKKY